MDASQINESQETVGAFIVAHGNTAKFLEFQKEKLEPLQNFL